jgi:hypothetical protein
MLIIELGAKIHIGVQPILGESTLRWLNSNGLKSNLKVFF